MFVRVSILSAALSFLLLGRGYAQGDLNKGKDPEPIDGLKALKNPDPTVRYNAVVLLGQLGPIGKFAVAELKEMAYKDLNGVVRVKAAEALWKIEPPAPSFILPVLEQALRDKNDGTRASAPAVFVLLGKKAKSAIPALIEALKDKNLDVKMEVILALGELGPVAKDAAGPLLQLVEDKEFFLLEPMTGASLANLGPDAIPVLVKALGDKQVPRRRLAIYALSAQNPPPAAALGDLQTALQDKEPSVRGLAAKTLGRIGPEAKESIPPLRKLLKDDRASVRIQAALALFQIEGKADQISVLIAAFGDEDPFIRQTACQALGAMGQAAVEAVPLLILGLKDKEAMVRGASASALGNMGIKANQAEKALRDLFKDQDKGNRLLAALACWQITGQAQDPLKVFDSALESDSPQLRQALKLLAVMGKSAQPLSTRLLELYQAAEGAGRRPIAEALKIIDPQAAAKAKIK